MTTAIRTTPRLPLPASLALTLALTLAAATAAFGAATETLSTPDSCLAAAVDATLQESPAAGRDELLRKGLELDPDHGALRAERGEVRFDGRWLPVWYAQHLASEDPRVAEYQQRLEDLGDTPREHAGLAAWCKENGLRAEARAHWLRVLESEPNHRAALEGLNAEWRDGRLWDRALAEKAEAEAEKTEDAAKHWERRLADLEAEYRIEPEQWESLAEDLDAAAAGPIENRALALRDADDSRLAERRRRLLAEFLTATQRLDDPEVTASLCRLAVMAPSAAVRDQAGEALVGRPEEDSVPMLLSALIAPIESESRIIRDREGNVVYEHRLRRQADDRTNEHLRRRTADVVINRVLGAPDGFRVETRADAVYKAMIQARFEGLKTQIAYQNEAEQTNAQAVAYNAVASGVNGRVVERLTQLTGRNLGDEPRLWWDYWREYTGYDSYERPFEQTYETSYSQDYVTADPTYIRLPPPPPPTGGCECFVAGTPVWTRTGQRPIDELAAGDLVLARDPDRGDLTFRAVLATTVRDPSPMLEVVAGGETIRCTVGHPFWVVGQGWRMAKQFREGDLVSAVDGPVRVGSVEPMAPRRAYNLVVEGAANYYVGESGLLVHDNTPRRPAVGLLTRR
ncbi:Hint domain-containing protein [Botrimarina sp.]|uniref:Hint domain-containing protein n=1 Tax=Botrimarina sp. TaxID=2795802 RepID=UPI0032ED328C